MLVTNLTELKEALSAIDSFIILGYVRVSSLKESQSTSVERQVYSCQQHGANIIVVEKETGTNPERSLYKEITNLIDGRRITKIIATRSDRINRNSHEMSYFYRLCSERQTEWEFIDQPESNSESSWGAEIRAKYAFEAQQESERTSRRLARYYATTKSRGKAVARQTFLGYRINSDRQYELDTLKNDASNALGLLDGVKLSSFDLAEKLLACYFETKALRPALRKWKAEVIDLLEVIDEKRIKQLARFETTCFTRWLQDPVLRGHTAYGKSKTVYYGEKLQKKKRQRIPPEEWEITYNTHPDHVLISPTQWLTIQSYLQKNQQIGYYSGLQRSRNAGLPESLSCILKCACCGWKFSLTTCKRKNGKIHRHYRCNGRSSTVCKAKGISELKLWDAIVPKLCQNAQDITNSIDNSLQGSYTVNPQQLAMLKNEVEEAENKFHSTGMSEFLTLQKKFERQVELLENQIELEQKQVVDKKALLESLSDPEFWQSLDNFSTNTYLKEIIQTCWLDNGKIVKIDLNL